MSDKEYIEFLDQYADLIRTYSAHFEGLRDNWKEATGRNCPFITRELTYESGRMVHDIEWEKRDIISASLLETELVNYLN